MKIYLPVIYAFLIFETIVSPAFSQDSTYTPDKHYSPNELRSDLHFLHHKLDSTHPGLYHYTSKETINTFFDSLDHSITHSLTEQEFLSMIMLLNPKICDGHTMFLASEEAMSYNSTRGRFFPFTVIFNGNRLYITENCSADSTIRPGTEIIAINGQHIPAVKEQLLQRQIRDGHNQTYPLWILHRYFAAYYAYTFGQPESFSLSLADSNGVVSAKMVRSLTREVIRSNRQKRYESLNPQPANNAGITFERPDAANTAILTIKSFDADWLKNACGQDFFAVTDSLFNEVSKLQISNLLLDLRNNQGGDFETGRHLLSYLIRSPSRYLTGSSEARLLQPKENNFGGRLFVLVNGGSFSNTAIVSACLKRGREVVFIGEETGGNESFVYGEPTLVVLPHTGIQAYISTTAFPITQTLTDHGIIPDHQVIPSVNDMISRKDPAKTLALQMIPEKR